MNEELQLVKNSTSISKSYTIKKLKRKKKQYISQILLEKELKMENFEIKNYIYI